MSANIYYRPLNFDPKLDSVIYRQIIDYAKHIDVPLRRHFLDELEIFARDVEIAFQRKLDEMNRKRALRLGEMADALAHDFGKFNDAHHPVERTNGSAPQVKAKRKPVTADTAQIGAVLRMLDGVGQPVTIKNISQATKLGPKIIGSALRALMAIGQAIEQPRGKFRAVKPTTGVEEAGE